MIKRWVPGFKEAKELKGEPKFNVLCQQGERRHDKEGIYLIVLLSVDAYSHTLTRPE